jgi:hypothetical protein
VLRTPFYPVDAGNSSAGHNVNEFDAGNSSAGHNVYEVDAGNFSAGHTVNEVDAGNSSAGHVNEVDAGNFSTGHMVNLGPSCRLNIFPAERLLSPMSFLRALASPDL